MHNHSHDHHHHHDDGHAHSHQTHLQKKFKFAVVVTFCVFLGELIGGIWSGSLALLSDAMHVMSDVFSLLISWLAIYLSTRPATASRTYGYHRAEVFALLGFWSTACRSSPSPAGSSTKPINVTCRQRRSK